MHILKAMLRVRHLSCPAYVLVQCPNDQALHRQAIHSEFRFSPRATQAAVTDQTHWQASDPEMDQLHRPNRIFLGTPLLILMFEPWIIWDWSTHQSRR